MSGAAQEALRQQMLLRALWADAGPEVVAGWLRDGPRAGQLARGLAAYRGNAGAVAERTLAAAYPTLQQLLGEASFAALARACWLRHAPTAGDLGLWGDMLPTFIADAESLAGEPYLPDVARLEWAVHRAERAADASPPRDLERLGSDDPAALALRLAPGTALVDSRYPVVTLWQAHRSQADDRFAPVRAAFDAGTGECALVVREGWRATVLAVAAGEARYTQVLLAGGSLAAALTAAGDGFDFQTWLIEALQRRRLVAVDPLGVITDPPAP
jgi:hypothetical protein